MGTTSEMQKMLSSASICAYPSAYEGFSLALTEAMAAGLPTIGFKNSDGVNQLIKNNKNGYLVDDINEFASKIELLINNEELRNKLSEEGKKQMHSYTPENIIKQWDELIKSFLNITT